MIRPAIPTWEAEPPRAVQPLMETGPLEGRTNASARMGAYALRNMLLLRVIVSRAGEYEQTVWSMLNETLDHASTAPSWLYTTRYWCALAPRPPEDLEQERLHAIKTPFGVLCLGHEARPHLLVYPDARTESRAHTFLGTLAAELDWYMVQAHYRREAYESHASGAVRNQQRALEQVTRTAQAWNASGDSARLPTLDPLHAELNALEAAYTDMLADLQVTRTAAQEMRALAAEYRLTLMQQGLWDAAPTVWQARAADLEEIQVQIEADVQHIDHYAAPDRDHDRHAANPHGPATRRADALIYLVTLFGLALLAVLVADTNLPRMAIRLIALAVMAGIVWYGWQRWLRARLP